MMEKTLKGGFYSVLCNIFKNQKLVFISFSHFGFEILSMNKYYYINFIFEFIFTKDF
jgi:hypothetical protein